MTDCHKIGILMQFDCSDRYNFQILKMHDGGGCHSDKDNRKIASLTDRHHLTLSILLNKTANIIKTKLVSVSLSWSTQYSTKQF